MLLPAAIFVNTKKNVLSYVNALPSNACVEIINRIFILSIYILSKIIVSLNLSKEINSSKL